MNRVLIIEALCQMLLFCSNHMLGNASAFPFLRY
jgi:hypothetical protein